MQSHIAKTTWNDCAKYKTHRFREISHFQCFFERKLFFEEKKNWLCHKKLFKKFYNSICIYFAIDNVSFLKITEQNTYIYSQGKFPNIKTEIRKLLQLKDESIPSFFTVSTKMITGGISRFLYTKTWYVFFIITIQTLLCLPIQRWCRRGCWTD